jgi:hypothetical protein
MIRKIIIPQSTTITLALPDDYVGKEVEIIVFSLDEAANSAIIQSDNFTKEWSAKEEDEAWKDL